MARRYSGVIRDTAVLRIAYTSMVPREVNATINGEKTTVMSREHTIEDFLETENIKYCKADYISSLRRPSYTTA